MNNIAMTLDAQFCKSEEQLQVVRYLYETGIATYSNPHTFFTGEDIIRGMIIATAILTKVFDLQLSERPVDDAVDLFRKAYDNAQLDMNIPTFKKH